MKFFPVIKWMVRLCLLAILIAGTTAAYYWVNGSALIQKELLRRFDEIAPELQLVIGSVEIRGSHATILHQLEVHDRATKRPLFRAKQLAIDLDSRRLVEQQQVVVNAILLQSADILLAREADGQWNWQKYKFVPPSGGSVELPEIVLEDTRVQLTLKHGDNIPTARLLLTSPTIQAVPRSGHAYDFDGQIELPAAGLLNLTGGCDLASREWNLSGRLRDVQAGRQLMDLARSANPGVEQQLEQLDSRIERLLPLQSVSAVERPGGAALLIGNDSSIAPQFFGVLDVDFEASGMPKMTVPQFRLRVEVREGRLGSSAIPVTLSDVKARFYRDNDNLIFQLDEAHDGDASLSGGLEMRTGLNAAPGKAWFDVKKFPVSLKLKPLLPVKTQRMFDAFSPEAVLSAKGQILQQLDGSWRPQDLTGQVENGTATFHKFRYPAQNLSATLQQRPFVTAPAQGLEPSLAQNDVMIDVRISGALGQHSFTAEGWWKNPGVDNQTRIDMSIPRLPIDGPFRSALDERQLRVVESLNLNGDLTSAVTFYRPAGPDQITETYVDGRLSNGSLKFEKFPYEVQQLTGRVKLDVLRRNWEFPELRGRHGEAVLQAQGTFRGDTAPGTLNLSVTATNGALDADLYNALSQPQRSLWNTLRPEGFCDLTTHIHWTAVPGQSAIVLFPEETPVRIYNTKIRPTHFPLDMRIVEAFVSFNPNDPRYAGVQHCTIHSFQALHDDSPIQATGWAEAKPDGEWQLHLNDITATNLKPDDNLRAALPESWRQPLSRLNTTGSVSVENSEIDFRGVTSGAVSPTSRWDLNLRFRDCTMNAGLDLNHVYGFVNAEGVWDGVHLSNTGQIQIETAEVLDMPFTNIQGPYSLSETELVLGSREVFTHVTLAAVNRQNRIKAQAYGGEVLLDAMVDLRQGGRHRLFTEISNALLEAYAARHIPDQQTLRGVVRAWMSLEGSADSLSDLEGQGQLQISPAALYQLPVMVKLMGALSQLKFNVQDNTAFDYALLDFNVKNEAFEFDRIDLVGGSISLRGRGSVGFGGDVLLDFYSRPPRPTAASIPILNRLLTQWTKVEVRGTTSRPQTMSRPLGQLDQPMQQFLTAFNPTPGGPAPLLAAPRIFQHAPPLLPRLRQQTANEVQRN